MSIATIAALLPIGWHAGADGESVVCPHGITIALDGECGHGCKSPIE